jgi:FkbM family methyltransferase
MKYFWKIVGSIIVSIAIIAIFVGLIIWVVRKTSKKYLVLETSSGAPIITEFLEPQKKDTEELVVAVCMEDVTWIDKYADKYKLVTVYNKCGKKLEFTSTNVKVIESPNIGTCDHAFLSYIIDRYDNLPDFVEFTKGWKHPKGVYPNCLPCKQNLADFNNIKKFKLDNYHYANPINRKAIKTQYYKSGYKNMGAWIKDNEFLKDDLYLRNTCNIIYGGQFGTTAEQIHRTPKKVWEKLRSQQKHPREEVDHFIERTWRPLLCKPKYKLVVVAIFKNEAVAMREWLQHYMRQGVEHFYMIDNGSTDDWKSQIEGAPVTVYTDAKKHAQESHYNDYFLPEVKRNAEWVMVLDLDEFMYARKKHKTIPEFLDTVSANITQISVKWKMFGSNGHIKQPNSIITGFTTRQEYRGGEIDCKSIVRSINLNKLSIHTHDHSGDTQILPAKMDEKSLEESPLHLNHYAIQSWNWFQDVKMTRGAVDNKDYESIRNKDYFTRYDWNDIKDTELYEIYSQRLPLYPLHNKDGDIIFNTSHEVKEQEILRDTLKDGDSVLQLGGNIGASCITASKVTNLTTNHCVEPQSSLIPVLKRNINANNSNSEVIHGIVSENCQNKKISSNDGDIGSFVKESAKTDEKNQVLCHSLHNIKPKNGYTYLFMDCEGCAPDFIKEYGEELRKHPIHTILYEEDQGSRTNPVDYTPVNNFMKQNNFKCEGNFHKVCKKQNSIIPKIIHKVLINDTGKIIIDNNIKEAQESWTKYNKDYTLKLWNLSDCREYLINNFPNIYIETFDNLIPYSYKCDFFRFCLIYNEGGWYSDWKEVCLVLHLLDNLGQDGEIIIFDDKNHKAKTPYQYTMTGFFGAIPKHYILKDTIDGIILNVKNKYYGRDCLYPTGPGILGEIVNKYSLKTLGYFDKNYYYHKKLGKIIEHKCKNCGQTQDWANGNNYGKLWREKKIYKN